MTTVTAKQLRENLSAYLDRMERGEEIAVIRHSNIIGSLAPAHHKQTRVGSTAAAAMRSVMQEMKLHNSKLDLSKGYKQLYGEMLEEKYGTHKR